MKLGKQKLNLCYTYTWAQRTGLNRRPRNHASYVTYDCDLHSIRHGRICRWTWRDRPLKKWPGVKMRRTRGSSSPCSGLELPICYAVSLTCSTRGQPCTAPPPTPSHWKWLTPRNLQVDFNPQQTLNNRDLPNRDQCLRLQESPSNLLPRICQSQS